MTVRAVHEDSDGNATSASGTVNVSVTDPDGTEVESGTATENGTGIYEYSLGGQSVLDRYTVAFDFDGEYTETVPVDVIGRRLVPLARLREQSDLASASGTVLRRVADAVEDWFAEALGFPPVPEGLRVTWQRHRKSRTLEVPDVKRLISVVSLTIGTTTYDSDEFYLADDRVILNASTADPLILGLTDPILWPTGKAVAHVEHGLEHPDEPLLRAGETLARYVVRTSNFPERAARIIDGDAEIVFSMPSADRPTGLPEVDGILALYDEDAAIG